MRIKWNSIDNYAEMMPVITSCDDNVNDNDDDVQRALKKTLIFVSRHPPSYHRANSQPDEFMDCEVAIVPVAVVGEIAKE